MFSRRSDKTELGHVTSERPCSVVVLAVDVICYGAT